MKRCFVLLEVISHFLGEETSYISFLIANFHVSEKHLRQLLEVTKDSTDSERDLARLQVLELLRGKHRDYSVEVAGTLLFIVLESFLLVRFAFSIVYVFFFSLLLTFLFIFVFFFFIG